MFHRKSVWVFGTLVTAIVFLTQFCSPPKEQIEDSFLNHSDTAAYVGMQSCAECHLDKAQTFVHTGMGMSFDTVSRAKSSANLHTNHVLYDSFNNFYYYPFWKQEELYVTEFRLDDTDTVYQRTEKINYIIGSGQHTNSHLIKKGDYIVQAPFTWYAQDEKLDFPPGFENGANSRFSRVIDQECMSCHNGLPQMKPETSKAFAYVPNGIDCERCHGPGSIHVALRKEGNGPVGEIDYSIVNPSRLTWERQIDVCQRCHLQGNNVLKPNKNFGDFKPGMVLSDVFEVFLPKYADDNQLFNMANHADRFQHSQCFIKSNKSTNAFTCITCHNPHVTVKETSSVRFNASCNNCHTSSTSLCKEQTNVRALKGDNCVACHMPKSGTEDIPHVTVHDHKIGIYKNTNNEGKSEVVGLYSVNNQNTDIETQIRAYLTYYEKFDPLPIYQEKATELLSQNSYPELQVHLLYQKQRWSEIVEVVEDKSFPKQVSGVSSYRIGKAYAYSNNLNQSINWLNLAVIKAPGEFAFKNELASQLIKSSDFVKAESVLLAGRGQMDDYVPIHNNLGYLYILTQKYSKAKSSLLRSLALDPDNLKGKENLVLMYGQLHDIANEMFWLKEVIEQDPNHDAALKRYSQLYESKL
jgi:hypothetical protein